MYGRIERFEGTDANRLDASEDEQRRRVVGKSPENQPAPPDPAAELAKGVARVAGADDLEANREP